MVEMNRTRVRTQVPAAPERDERLDILNALLTTPHRRLDGVWPVHRDLADRDPRFYVRLAAWYADHGDVRDHKEMFVVCLALSDFDGHRDVGLAMLRELPPYEVARVVDFVHGRLGRNVPRSLKTEVARYLREREGDAPWFDSSVLAARRSLKRLYALLHVRPGPRAQAILFDRRPPADSRLAAVRDLAAAATPAEQAAVIVERRIPYRVATTVLRQMTPSALAALVTSMSPQELINSLGSLRRRGALDHAVIKGLVDEKLEQARTASRVSAFKADRAADAAALPDDVRRKLEQVADTQVKAKGRITRPTALLVDKSGSMHVAIELGKRLAAMISAVCDSDLFVYAFDTVAYRIVPAGTDLADWQRAFRGLKATGATSCGVAVECLRRARQRVEQVILVTDEGENAAPKFVKSLLAYGREMKVEPSVCLVRTPDGWKRLEGQCRDRDIDVDVFPFTGDYYALPNLVPLLARPSKLELLQEILEYPLPRRRPA